MELLFSILGFCVLGIFAFAILTVKDLIKYLVRKSRIKKGMLLPDNTQAFPRLLKRNLILLPLGIIGLLAFYTVLAFLIPPM
jgi:hypothetical protein